ncbi:LCP family protein [Geomicrobium sp. JCM 19055]|uniref:LCP family protein n=1 Tax=Geomicrobium sp. JCM 19055 TaxID=1460649 RepID=UPI00045ECCE4|nr:LCP family protein [Geomicrobium sp. JCM 19055]GAK00977.1 cell envelope-associated transcriptional attenuator LytR-CpsA-Psr [Geomicrobium sp. JCM 19055]
MRKINDLLFGKVTINKVYFLLVLVILLVAIPLGFQSTNSLIASDELDEQTLHAQQAINESVSDIEAVDEPFQVLMFSVNDQESDNSSAIMLAQFDPADGDTRIVSLLSDSYVSVPGHQNHKLGSVYQLGGLELLEDTLLENFQLSVDYFVKVDIEGFASMVNTIAPTGINLDNQRYYGEDFVHYIRDVGQGEFDRTNRHQQIVSHIHDYLLDNMTVRDAQTLIAAFTTHLETNIPTGKLFRISTDYINSASDSIAAITIPYRDSYTYEYSLNKDEEIISFDSQLNKDYLHSFLDEQLSLDELDHDFE